MNDLKQLFEPVKEYLRAHPEELNMCTWGGRKVNEQGVCQTVMCIAGTLVSIHDRVQFIENVKTVNTSLTAGWIQERAMQLVGCSPNNSVPLFYTGSWPIDLIRRFNAAGNAEQAVGVACEAIDQYVSDPDSFYAEGTVEGEDDEALDDYDDDDYDDFDDEDEEYLS